MTLAALSQPGILAAPLALGRSLHFRLLPETDARAALTRFRNEFPIEWGVFGIGEEVVRALGAGIEGLRTFPAMSGPAAPVPSTQAALWVFLRAGNRTDLFDRSAQVVKLLEPAFELEDSLETFTYRDGRDLSGYLDGTANPNGDEAVEAGLVDGAAAGSSFVAVQRWIHDLERFASFSPKRRDDIVGRRISDNEEFEEAPESSHVKRTAQENYDPPAFMVRRSMPWADGVQSGLEFIAYGNTLDKFERMMVKMAGLSDGIVDALFTFSRPVRGSYFWCPPVREGKLDLKALGI